MPDTPDIAAIRERAAREPSDAPARVMAWHDRRALLAHIDALTAAVEGTSTMPDTPEQRMIDIRQSHENRHYYGRCDNDCDTGWLLAHIDALTAAVDGLPETSPYVTRYRAKVLAILRGEQ